MRLPAPEFEPRQRGQATRAAGRQSSFGSEIRLAKPKHWFTKPHTR